MALSCRDVDELSSRELDGRLTRDETVWLDEHARACAPCAARRASYHRVFGLVASWPLTTTDEPAPLPDSSTTFRRRPALSMRVRAASAAGIVILLGGVGWASYRFGRSTLPEAGPVQPSAAVAAVQDPVSVRLPARPGGSRLRRLHDNTRYLGALVEAADTGGTVADDHLIRAVDRMAAEAPLVDDARYLRRLDEASLGSFEAPVHELASGVLEVLRTIEAGRERAQAPRARLELISGSLREAEVPSRLRALQHLAAHFDAPAPGPGQDVVLEPMTPEDDLALGCVMLGQGRLVDAARLLNRATSADAELAQPVRRFLAVSGLSLEPGAPVPGSGGFQTLGPLVPRDPSQLLHVDRLGADGVMIRVEQLRSNERHSIRMRFSTTPRGDVLVEPVEAPAPELAPAPTTPRERL